MSEAMGFLTLWKPAIFGLVPQWIRGQSVFVPKPPDHAYLELSYTQDESR